MTTPSSSVTSRTDQAGGALTLDDIKADDGALDLLRDAERPPRYAADLDASSSTCLALDVPTTCMPSSQSMSIPTTSCTSQAHFRDASGTRAPVDRASNVSAVYRWYDVEEGYEAKKREESSLAKCKVCQTQGKQDRKTWVRFSKSVTSNLWRHLKENHPHVYAKHAGEKKRVLMHRITGSKKRGRKKKGVATSSLSCPLERDAAPVIAIGHEARTGQGTTMPPSVKKPKRGEQEEDPVPPSFFDSPLDMRHPMAHAQPGASPGSSATASGAVPTGKAYPEKVREAIGYLCLYEMLPFQLCSSHAFQNLIVACSGGYVHGSTNVLAVSTKDIAFEYATNLAAEVQMRTLMQMEMTEFSHLLISEWRASTTPSHDSTLSPSQINASILRDSECVFYALFAVGLDPDFNSFRRCLHVSSMGTYRPGQEESIGAMLARDQHLRKAMECLVPSKCMPEILAVEPSCSEYESFRVTRNLRCLESIPTVLQHIMLATISGVTISGSYCLAGDPVGSSAAVYRSLGCWNRRLDKGESIPSTSTAVLPAETLDRVSAAEMSSRILEELPRSLTGHTYRDLLNKLMYLLAHLKQSARSRDVLRTVALEQCSMSAASYERLFIDRLRAMAISIDQLYAMLMLVADMRPALQAYFVLHKDRESDFSKLIQLTCLSPYEWSRVRYLRVILKPFAEATAKLDGEVYVISSLIVPSAFTMLEKLREPHPVHCGTGVAKTSATEQSMESLPEDIEALRDLAFSNLSTCFGYLFSVPNASWGKDKLQTFNLLWCATILDPRTRSFIVKGSLPQEEYWEIVKAEAINMVANKDKDQEGGKEPDESSKTVADTGVEQSTDLWDDLQANLALCAQEQMLLHGTKSSLEATKSSNLLEVEVSFFQEEGRIVLRANPFEWWHTMRMKYPLLARLARYVLSIPGKVTIDNNPVGCDGGLVKQGPSHLSMVDLCHLLAASMNLRTEKLVQLEVARKHVWTTV
ncbi:hypothetical protein PsorP6_017101 [Peronosclerospora sorghi]|uniref:Uncharacterized protein n=1 Tax=Peronosclerospora sorghi TaxID=230839 RepID=A0ACC0WDA9_9STRA|nr:hypothetical protein PsorP6_017101 [Peronosclerospora sorghi]